MPGPDALPAHVAQPYAYELVGGPPFWELKPAVKR